MKYGASELNQKRKDEPAVFGGAVLVLVNAVLMLLIEFGVELTARQATSIMGVVNSALALVAVFWIRARVVAVDPVMWEARNENYEIELEDK